MDKQVADKLGLRPTGPGRKTAGLTIYEAQALENDATWLVWCANKKTQGKLSKWYEAVSELSQGECPNLKCVESSSGLWVASACDFGVSLVDYKVPDAHRVGEIIYLAYQFIDAVSHLKSRGVPLDKSMFASPRVWQRDTLTPKLILPGLSPVASATLDELESTRLAGRFLYVLLTGERPPTEQAPDTVDLDGERVGAFDSLLLDWVEEHTMSTGLGDLAMQAYEEQIDATEFSKALYPHFEREVSQLVAQAENLQSTQDQSLADAETSRSRVRELEDSITEQEQWLKANAEEIERAEQRVCTARDRLRQLEALDQEVASQLGLESKANFDRVHGDLEEEHTPHVSSAAPLPPACNEADIELDPNQLWPDDPRESVVRAPFKDNGTELQSASVQDHRAAGASLSRLPVFVSGTVSGAVVMAILVWFTLSPEDKASRDPRSETVHVVTQAHVAEPSLRSSKPLVTRVEVIKPSIVKVETIKQDRDAMVRTSMDAGSLERQSETTIDEDTNPGANLSGTVLMTLPKEMARQGGGALKGGLTQRQAKRLVEACFNVFEVAARRCTRLYDEVVLEPVFQEDAPFGLDRTEVEFTDYQACVNAKVCTNPAHQWNKENYPVTGVSGAAAEKYCRWIKKRLPTIREWMFAVRTAGAGRVYPWGVRLPSNGQANLGSWSDEPSTESSDGYRYVAPISSYRSGGTEVGIINLVGNVKELVRDDEGDGYLAPGGGYLSLGFEGRVTARPKVSSDKTATDLGFRCAIDL